MNPKIKISQLPAKGANLAAGDLLEVAEFTGTGYVSKSITGQEIIDAASGSGVTDVTATAPLHSTGGTTPDISIAQASNVDEGYLSSADWIAFNDKQDALVSGTNIKTVEGQSLLGSGNINITATDVGLGNVNNTSDANKPVSTATQTALNAKQDTLVSATNIKTINGTTILGSGNIAIASGITIGTTAITSGVVGRVLFEGAGNVVQDSANLFWDNTNGQLSLLTDSNLAASALTGLNVRNTNATGYANTLWYNNNLDIGQFMMTGTAGAIAGTNIIARQANFINAGGTGGINLLATAGNITFLAGAGSVSKVTMFTSGNLAINTTTDAGFRLDVNGTARVSGNTRIGTTVYSDTSSGLVIGGTGAAAARATLASPTLYQDFQFVKTDIASGNINSWGFGQRQDTYFGNALGSFQIVGAYVDNSGAVSMVGGGFRVPLICNPNGDIIISGASNSINGNVSVGSSTVVASALLSVTSTTKGFLPPRMTTTQKNAIATPAAGLMVYDTTLNLISVWNGTTWITL